MMIPKVPEEFTADWLNQALASRLGDAEVQNVTVKASEVPGQTAEIAFLDITYSDPNCGLATSVVAKYTSQNPQVIADIISNYDQYRRETSFYSEFPDVGIATPDCLYVNYDQSRQEFVILLANLSPAESPSWAVTDSQVAMAVGALPGLHAKWWRDPVLRQKDWIVQFDNKEFFGAAMGAAHMVAPIIKDLYGEVEPTQRAMALMAEKLDAMLAWTATRPFTFVHGDFHAKQMFFPTDEGGEFAVIDWQFPFVAPGAWDVSRIIGLGLTDEQRQSQMESLVAGYHVALTDRGVTDYSRDELDIDISYGLAVSQMIMVIASAQTDVTLIQKECYDLGVDWQDMMLYRTQNAMLEWNTLELLESI